ncbi:hypothetical protein PtA15_7A390 [Puccinia triticina]|uniref:Uncharacterized protein n=1 Tax=Puccinia triticina TaxID=208348 RepID=A0ABY7CQC3_9BASI|nr:uncharacterized protein PtA15_7A390 [Puccinia triticina]WAQ86662.1 hypothetical protein PtA15_7A390 [Puccinia triticina]
MVSLNIESLKQILTYYQVPIGDLNSWEGLVPLYKALKDSHEAGRATTDQPADAGASSGAGSLETDSLPQPNQIPPVVSKTNAQPGTIGLPESHKTQPLAESSLPPVVSNTNALPGTTINGQPDTQQRTASSLPIDTPNGLPRPDHVSPVILQPNTQPPTNANGQPEPHSGPSCPKRWAEYSLPEDAPKVLPHADPVPTVVLKTNAPPGTTTLGHPDTHQRTDSSLPKDMSNGLPWPSHASPVISQTNSQPGTNVNGQPETHSGPPCPKQRAESSLNNIPLLDPAPPVVSKTDAQSGTTSLSDPNSSKRQAEASFPEGVPNSLSQPHPPSKLPVESSLPEDESTGLPQPRIPPQDPAYPSKRPRSYPTPTLIPIRQQPA